MISVYVARKVNAGTLESRSRHFLPPLIVVEEKGSISIECLERVLGERIQNLLREGKLDVRDREIAKKIIGELGKEELEGDGDFVELILVVEDAK